MEDTPSCTWFLMRLLWLGIFFFPELTRLIFYPLSKLMHGETGPFKFSNAIPIDKPFLVNSSLPLFRSTTTPMISPFREGVVKFSIIFLWIFWPLRHVIPHSDYEEPRWDDRLLMDCTYWTGRPVGIYATPTMICHELEDASIFKSIWISYLWVPDLQVTLPTIFSQS